METLKKIGGALKGFFNVGGIGGNSLGGVNLGVNSGNSKPVTPTTNTQTAPVPSVKTAPIKINIPTPTITPKVTTTQTVNPPVNFKLDNSNITTDHLAGENTPNSVLNSLNAEYKKNIAPYDLYSATIMSPAQMGANQNLLQQEAQARQLQQNYLAGVSNIMGRPEAMDFQQGQEAALTRQNALLSGQQALNVQAATEQANYLENVRANRVAAAQAGQTQAQNIFGNQITAYTAGLQGQQVNQGRYEYQQITDPNTGFPTIQVIDKQTGLLAGSVAPGSAQGQSLIQSGQVIGSQNGAGIVNGYNIASYATDPNHETSVNNIYNAITQGVAPYGGVTNPQVAQGVINSIAPNSPITGDMVIASATKYGVDPTLMISIMHQDSQMGTQGKGAKTFNPGNVGNDDSGRTVNMGSWQNGVDAVAQWLSNHKQTSSIGQGTGIYDQLKLVAPSAITSAIQPVGNSAYIDSSLLADPKFGVMASNFAKQYGIPVLDSTLSNELKNIQQSENNIQTLFDSFTRLAPESFAGKTGDTLTNWYSKTFGTDYGNDLKAFQSNQDTVYKQVNALAGSSPRLSTPELGIAKSSMPNLSGVSKDTLEQGVSKATLIMQYHDNAMRKAIPNYVGTPLRVNDTTYAVRLNDGKVHYYQSKDIATQALKLNLGL